MQLEKLFKSNICKLTVNILVTCVLQMGMVVIGTSPGLAQDSFPPPQRLLTTSEAFQILNRSSNGVNGSFIIPPGTQVEVIGNMTNASILSTYKIYRATEKLYILSFNPAFQRGMDFGKTGIAEIDNASTPENFNNAVRGHIQQCFGKFDGRISGSNGEVALLRLESNPENQVINYDDYEHGRDNVVRLVSVSRGNWRQFPSDQFQDCSFFAHEFLHWTGLVDLYNESAHLYRTRFQAFDSVMANNYYFSSEMTEKIAKDIANLELQTYITRQCSRLASSAFGVPFKIYSRSLGWPQINKGLKASEVRDAYLKNKIEGLDWPITDDDMPNLQNALDKVGSNSTKGNAYDMLEITCEIVNFSGQFKADVFQTMKSTVENRKSIIYPLEFKQITQPFDYGPGLKYLNCARFSYADNVESYPSECEDRVIDNVIVHPWLGL